MSNFNNIARPYALAAFEFAKEHHQLDAWKNFLYLVALIAKDSQVAQLLANPEVSNKKSYKVFSDLLGDSVDQKQLNFLLLLAENHRLIVLPSIAELFNEHYAVLEKKIDVRVVTAIKPNDAFEQQLSDALVKRLNREVKIFYEIDPAVIGGAIIYMGDRVIDGSIRGKLTRLLEYSLR